MKKENFKEKGFLAAGGNG